MSLVRGVGRWLKRKGQCHYIWSFNCGWHLLDCSGSIVRFKKNLFYKLKVLLVWFSVIRHLHICLLQKKFAGTHFTLENMPSTLKVIGITVMPCTLKVLGIIVIQMSSSHNNLSSTTVSLTTQNQDHLI